MTSFSVCRVWGLFFAVLPLVMATSYAQDAGVVEAVDVLEPYNRHVQPDEMIVVEGAILAKRGTPEGTFVEGTIQVGYSILVPVIAPKSGNVEEISVFIPVDEVGVSGFVEQPPYLANPIAIFRVVLRAPARGWRVSQLYEVIGTPEGIQGLFICVDSRPELPGSGEGGPNSEP